MAHNNKKTIFDYEMITRLSALGLNIKEICTVIGITDKTWCHHLKEDELLQQAVEQGRLEPVRKVEEALFKKATGYTIEEVKMINGKPIEKKIKEVVPSDTAIIFFLKNHCPEKYKDEFRIKTDLASQLGAVMGK